MEQGCCHGSGSKRNVGGVDRAIRFFVGVGLIAFGLVKHSWWGAIGIVPLLTSMMGFCPAYTLLGLKTTCANKQECAH